MNLDTPAGARRRYLGVTAALHKREGALKASVAYTWAQLEGNVDNNETNDYGLNPARDLYYQYGYLPDDARHTMKTSLTYQMTPWLSLGVIHRYFSGRPYSRMFYNNVEGGFVDYRAQRGYDPGSNLNDPKDDRELRLPDLQQLNLQVRGNLKPLLGFRLDAYVDVINLLAQRTTTWVVTQDGPAFGRPTSRSGPLTMRLGLRYRY